MTATNANTSQAFGRQLMFEGRELGGSRGLDRRHDNTALPFNHIAVQRSVKSAI